MHVSHCRIVFDRRSQLALAGMYELLRVRSRRRLQRLWNQFVQATILPFSGGATWSDNGRKGMTNFRHTGYTWYTFWLPLRRAKEQTLQTCWLPVWFGNWQTYQAAGASGTLGHALTVHNVHLQSASSFGAKIWSYIYLTLIRPIWWSPMKPNAYLAWNAAFEPLWTDYMWHYIWLYIIWLYSPLNKCCIGHLQWRKRQEGWSCSFYVSTAVNSWPSEVGHPQDEGSVNMLSSPTCGWLQ